MRKDFVNVMVVESLCWSDPSGLLLANAEMRTKHQAVTQPVESRGKGARLAISNRTSRRRLSSSTDPWNHWQASAGPSDSTGLAAPSRPSTQVLASAVSGLLTAQRPAAACEESSA